VERHDGLRRQCRSAHTLYVGLAAYTSAALFVHAGLGPWLGLWIAIAVAALVGGAIGALASASACGASISPC